MPGPDEAIAPIVSAYQSAVYDKNVDAFMQLYDPSARVFDMWGVWSYEGAAAWRQAVGGWLNSLGDERVSVTFNDVQATVSGGLALVSAIVTYASMSSEGEQLRSMQNRLSWVLQGNGGAFRIVHEHTSAPVGFEDMRAILAG